jgi:hypothetical protein
MVRLDSLTRFVIASAFIAAWAASPVRAQRVANANAPAPRVPPAPSAPALRTALEARLRDLALDPLCNAEGVASFRCEARVTPPGSTEPLTFRAVANDETRTVFLSVPDLARAAPDAPRTPTLLRRLAELNWELLLGKLEWNAASGEVRLTLVLPTHGGLDRDALGVMVRALVALAGRLGPELRTIAAR